jgi:hypothetical protein
VLLQFIVEHIQELDVVYSLSKVLVKNLNHVSTTREPLQSVGSIFFILKLFQLILKWFKFFFFKKK